MAKQINKIHIVGTDGDYTMFIHFSNSTKTHSCYIWNYRDFDGEPHEDNPYIVPFGEAHYFEDFLDRETSVELARKIDDGEPINQMIELNISIRELS